MKVDINSKKVSDLISVPFLSLVGIGLLVAVYGLFNALVW